MRFFWCACLFGILVACLGSFSHKWSLSSETGNLHHSGTRLNHPDPISNITPVSQSLATAPAELPHTLDPNAGIQLAHSGIERVQD